MTHAHIPDFSQPVPARAVSSARRPLPVDRRYIAMSDETQPGTIEAWEAVTPNVAGKLMNWLGDALTNVESAANKEVKRRRPATPNDRATRLEMLALPVIQNGDHDETAAFARELAAHAEAEQARR